MIGARGVPADAESADDLSFLIVKSEPSAKNNYSADWLAYKRVIRLAEFLRIAGECGVRIRPTHNAVQRTPGLSGGKYIAG